MALAVLMVAYIPGNAQPECESIGSAVGSPANYPTAAPSAAVFYCNGRYLLQRSVCVQSASSETSALATAINKVDSTVGNLGCRSSRCNCWGIYASGASGCTKAIAALQKHHAGRFKDLMCWGPPWDGNRKNRNSFLAKSLDTCQALAISLSLVANGGLELNFISSLPPTAAPTAAHANGCIECSSNGNCTACLPSFFLASGQCHPVVNPSLGPTMTPTKEPTGSPTHKITQDPTWQPTEEPTGSPTLNPTQAPAREPTIGPTGSPTQSPLQALTRALITHATESSTTSITRSLGEGSHSSSQPIGVIVTVVSVALLILGIGCAVTYMMRQKRAKPNCPTEAVGHKINAQIQDGAVLAETDLGKLFAVPFEKDQPETTPPVYEQDAPFGLSAQPPQVLPPLNEDGYVANPEPGPKRPVDANGYVLDKHIERPSKSCEIYSMPYNDGYLSVGRVMDAISSIAPASSTHPTHESVLAKCGADDDNDAEKRISQAPSIMSDDGYEPVERDETTNPRDANKTFAAVYSIPYEENDASLAKPVSTVYSLSSPTRLPEDAQAGIPVYTFASPEHQPGDYVQICTQKPYEDTEL